MLKKYRHCQYPGAIAFDAGRPGRSMPRRPLRRTRLVVQGQAVDDCELLNDMAPGITLDQAGRGRIGC